LYALDTGDVYDAYELYLSAGIYEPAHNIAVKELAPDAIIRRDLNLLEDIFERLEGKEDQIDGWSIRGKVSHLF
jgi:nuclear pore complex protein Nup98-Nup96